MTVNGRKIQEQILALLARKDYRPLNKIEIARKLGFTDTKRTALRKILRENCAGTMSHSPIFISAEITAGAIAY